MYHVCLHKYSPDSDLSSALATVLRVATDVMNIYS